MRVTQGQSTFIQSKFSVDIYGFSKLYFKIYFQTRSEEVTDLEAERDELLKENQILRKKAQKANELEHMIAELISSSEDGQPEDEAQAEEAKEE